MITAEWLPIQSPSEHKKSVWWLSRTETWVICLAHLPGDIVAAMTHFPQINPTTRASRVKIGGSVAIAIRSGGSQPIRAKLHELSVTGGLLILSKALEKGDFVELAFQTSQGTVHGMAEILSLRYQSKAGCLQPFRFVAMDDEDHTKLRMALDLLLDRTMVGITSGKSRSL